MRPVGARLLERALRAMVWWMIAAKGRSYNRLGGRPLCLWERALRAMVWWMIAAKGRSYNRRAL